MSTDKWTGIRVEYVMDTKATYRSLAKKYHVSLSTLGSRASREDWPGQREQYLNTVATKTSDICAEQAAMDLAEKLIPLQQAADLLSNQIRAVLEDVDQFYRYIVTEGVGPGETKTECRIMGKADTRAIKNLTAAVKELAIAIRCLYDIPTWREREEINLVKEKLSIDCERRGNNASGTQSLLVRFAKDDGIEDMAK
ncbi:MAG: hypothetical protein MJ124_07735 [Lachnospiraceae bacterium]|nr:hypothetical protein [Lachnospiraceae bacterium]